MKILSVFTVVLATLFLLTGCAEEEESVLEDLFVEEEEPVQEEVAVGPLPPHIIPENAPVITIEEIPKAELKGFGHGYRLRSDPAPEQDMVVQVRSFIRERVNGKEHFKKTFSFIIEKGKNTSKGLFVLKVNEERNTMIAFIISLPNPFPKLPLVFTRYDYRPPRENDKTLNLPDDYEFLLYRIGDQSRIEIEF